MKVGLNACFNESLSWVDSAIFFVISSVDFVASWLELPAPATPAFSPPVSTVGTPVALPPISILPAPRTSTAAIVMLPAEPMPASPAFTTPSGAIRSTLPGFTSGSVKIPRIPLPRTASTLKIVWPLGNVISTGAGADSAVLAPRPASISPFDDQIKMSPPPNVKTRDSLTSKLPRVKARTPPKS